MTQTLNLENSTTPSPDSNPYVFRGKRDISESPLTPSVRVEDSQAVQTVDAPLTFTDHESLTGTPFTSKYFQLDSVYADLKPADKNKINLLEGYITKKISSGEYQDSEKSAQEILKSLCAKLGLSDNHNPYHKLDKISEYMAVIKDPLREKTINTEKIKKEATVYKHRLKEVETKNAKLTQAFKKLLEAL
jgi:hypothetical protein